MAAKTASAGNLCAWARALVLRALALRQQLERRQQQQQPREGAEDAAAGGGDADADLEVIAL